MIEQRKDEIFEVVNDLEKVLDNLRDASISLPIQRAIDVLRRAMTVQVGDKQITFFSDDTVEFKQYIEPSINSEKVDEQNYVDTKTVADYYGVTPETVRNWIKQNIISGHQIGGPRGRFMIPKEEFEFLKAKKEYKNEETEVIMKELLGDDYTEDWESEVEE
ncbi:helix-turn-helix domain-containing protein [Robertmurraya andreesenii]|uniref:Transposase-like protein n=1 Tax=Anoxybacillus andreesenii TaxID=1325932 RepID=A0ABT9V8V3_9BACL|nr:helix-turn-helix domain-containing protein [Robertmurraya andreesenii]MDQ0157386.1 transposase-like protein [Robertmurraya andreesenii]